MLCLSSPSKGSAIVIAIALPLVLHYGCSCFSIGTKTELGTYLGEKTVTYYWVVFEQNYEEGKLPVELYGADGEILAVVPGEFAAALTMEGTGVLKDGRILNLYKECEHSVSGWCFIEVSPEQAPFGMAAANPLRPFRTVASAPGLADRGTVLYIPAFDGMPMPSEADLLARHDGCFILDDHGWSLTTENVDLFALCESYYREIDEQLEGATIIDVYSDSPKCPSDASELLHIPGTEQLPFPARPSTSQQLP